MFVRHRPKAKRAFRKSIMNSWRNMNLNPLGAKAPGGLIFIAPWAEAHSNLVEAHGNYS